MKRELKKEQNIFANIDWITVLIYLFLVLFGWLNIYAAVYDEAYPQIFDFSRQSGKQFIWIASSLLMAIFILIIDPKFFSRASSVIYGVAIFLLLAVLVMATATKGARSWFGFGDFGIQPSEFAKFATALVLAKYLSATGIEMKDLKTQIIAFGIILLPMALVLLQNDTGSALIFTVFILVLFRQGLSGMFLIVPAGVALLCIFTLLFDRYVVMIALVVIAVIIGFFSKRNMKNIKRLAFLLVAACAFVFVFDFAYDNLLQDHQKKRISVVLGLTEDIKGVGYHVNQSKIAIGSGGFFGKGFLNGTQTKYNFVPEQSTDFILCTVGEEWGFLGCLVVLSLYVFLFVRLITMAERQRSVFSQIYGYCVASILFIHFAINIGMAIGLLPVIGIPLPFLSYGGSSLWAFTILLFIFVRQDAARTQLI